MNDPHLKRLKEPLYDETHLMPPAIQRSMWKKPQIAADPCGACKHFFSYPLYVEIDCGHPEMRQQLLQGQPWVGDHPCPWWGARPRKGLCWTCKHEFMYPYFHDFDCAHPEIRGTPREREPWGNDEDHLCPWWEEQPENAKIRMMKKNGEIEEAAKG